MAEAGEPTGKVPPADPVRLLDLDQEPIEESVTDTSATTVVLGDVATAPIESAEHGATTEPTSQRNPSPEAAAQPPSELTSPTPSLGAESPAAQSVETAVAALPSAGDVATAREAEPSSQTAESQSAPSQPAPSQPAPSHPSPSRPAAARSKTPRPTANQARLPVSPSAESDPLDAMPSLRPSRPTSGSDYQRTGHPVRDRLLAKAAEVTKSREGATPGDESPTGAFAALRGMEAELEQLAGPRQKLVSEPVRVGKAVLSPTTTLIAITFIGLAAISSLFLLLAKFAPKGPPDASAVAIAPATATPTLLADPSAVPSVVLPPPVTPPERKRQEGPWRIGTAESGQRLIRGTIGSDPFLKAIEAAGLEKNQAYRVYGALKEHKDLDRCRPKDQFLALVNRADKRLVAFEYIVSKEEVYQAREVDGKLVGKRLDLKVNKHRVQGSILMTSAGFAAAAQNAGLEPSIGEVVNRALAGHTGVSQFRAGDRLRVVAQEVTVLGEFYRYAGIEALEYIPVGGEPIRIYYHAAKRQYYDAKGRAPGEGGWRNPVRGAPVTSKFNPHRLHPILKKKMPHNGTDFGAPIGTPIHAASFGKIVKLGDYGPNGNYVAIEHDNGYETGYSHLSRFEPGLKVGDNVKRGQVIGYVGTTGRSTGPHLHFSARKNGAYIDAESLRLDALTVLPAAERAAFQGIKEKYDALLEAVALPPALPPTLVASTPAPAHVDHDMEGDGEDGDPVAAAPIPPNGVVQPQPGAVAVTPPGAVSISQVPLAPPGTPLQGAPQATPLVGAPAPAVPVAPGGGFFLSDKDLLQSQPAVDDGEVDE